jgi:putative membrane protein
MRASRGGSCIEEQALASLWLTIFLAVLVWSGIQPRDYATWALEVAPALLGLCALWATRRSFPLTPLLYVLILLHCMVLMVGGHYTYAEVPLGDWVKPLFGFERNHYDRLGHFAQGFVPALIAREVLLRRRVLSRRAWLPFLVLCVCLALSAVYELIEWGVASWSGEAAAAFLGTQGDPWDTQSDMAFAGLGALAAPVRLALCFVRGIARTAHAPPCPNPTAPRSRTPCPPLHAGSATSACCPSSARPRPPCSARPGRKDSRHRPRTAS